MNSNITKCYLRDEKLIHTLDVWGVLTTEQIELLFFPSKRMAQRRLSILAKAKKIHRWRDVSELEYCYYTNKINNMQHRIGVNWVHMWLKKRLKSWESMNVIYETDYGSIIPDMIVEIKNSVTSKSNFIFVEYERHFDKFDKVKKYNDWYSLGAYIGEEWACKAERFPKILIVSEKILPIKNNSNNLEFECVTLSEIQDYVRRG